MKRREQDRAVIGQGVLELESRAGLMLGRRTFLRTAAMATTALVMPAALIGCQRSGGSELPNPEPLPDSDPMSPQRLHGWVRQLCEFQPRWAGYPGERRAGTWLADRLRDAGLESRIDTYSFRKWQLDDWKVELINGDGPEPVNSFPLWSSRGGEGSAELVDVGFGSEPELLARNLQGKAVVVTGKALLNVFATYPSTYHRAAELGAVAMFVTSDAPDNLIRPTSSSQNRLDDNPIPAFQLGARDLARLRRAARNGGSVAWRLEAYHKDDITRDVIGRLPGSGELEGSILVCAHYDAWFTGALDNATGVAGLIGLAEHFGSLPREARPRDMIFLGVTGHDAGYPHGGLTHWVSANQDRIPGIELFMNLDHLAAHGEEHIGGAGILDMLGLTIERPGDEERALFTTQHPALLRTFLPYLLRYGLLAVPLPTVPQVTANGDLEGMMGELGVPSVNLTMATPHYHTIEDTPERIPAEQLSRSVLAHRDFLSDVIGMTRGQIRSPI